MASKTVLKKVKLFANIVGAGLAIYAAVKEWRELTD